SIPSNPAYPSIRHRIGELTPDRYPATRHTPASGIESKRWGESAAAVGGIEAVSGDVAAVRVGNPAPDHVLVASTGQDGRERISRWVDTGGRLCSG
ncbi:MAG: hypothetical protein KBF43_10085, partial [Dermatophilaceae bacterium]|nr:hypothetical protein [Dermatophilaceae bacterium]